MMSKTSMLSSPRSTREAPYARAIAAPTAIPAMVIPWVAALLASTLIVERKTASARRSRLSPRAPLCPNALSVGSPWIESRKSAANEP